MGEIRDFKDLRIWQSGMDIAKRCYFLTKQFPSDERYGMVQQIRRAAVSIPANIAEGYGRRTAGEYKHLDMDEQTFEDFKSKYLDIYDRTRKTDDDDDPSSSVEEISFELELIQRDEINVAYILKLLAKLQQDTQGHPTPEQVQELKDNILKLLGRESQLRGKRDLIEKFMEERMPGLEAEQSMEEAFKVFWNEERVEAVKQLCSEENLDEHAVTQMISTYHFSGKEPLRETVFAALNERPKLLERKRIFKRVVARLRDIITKFDDDIGDLDFDG